MWDVIIWNRFSTSTSSPVAGPVLISGPYATAALATAAATAIAGKSNSNWTIMTVAVQRQ